MRPPAVVGPRGTRRGAAPAVAGAPLAPLALLALLFSGCAVAPPPVGAPAPSTPAPAPAPAPTPAAAPAGAAGTVAGRGERVLVYLPHAGDTIEAVAARFLGSAQLAWRIAQVNGDRWQLQPGQPTVVPLAPPSPHGVDADGVQTVPILCYHRFGGGPGKMNMQPAPFEAQLRHLIAERFHVLRLSELEGFLQGRSALPPRSVVITVDDGYESFHRLAFPLLKRYRIPVTLFVYTDIVGTRDGLSWAQLQELAESGLVDIQAHSRTHRNLTERADGESDEAYRNAVAGELRQPRALLERRLGEAGVKVRHFAYPYGDANDLVLDMLVREGYALGLTVRAGGNPFYAAPRLLRRTMIFGDHDLDDFKARLQITRSPSQP